MAARLTPLHAFGMAPARGAAAPAFVDEGTLTFATGSYVARHALAGGKPQELLPVGGGAGATAMAVSPSRRVVAVAEAPVALPRGDGAAVACAPPSEAAVSLLSSVTLQRRRTVALGSAFGGSSVGHLAFSGDGALLVAVSAPAEPPGTLSSSGLGGGVRAGRAEGGGGYTPSSPVVPLWTQQLLQPPAEAAGSGDVPHSLRIALLSVDAGTVLATLELAARRAGEAGTALLPLPPTATLAGCVPQVDAAPPVVVGRPDSSPSGEPGSAPPPSRGSGGSEAASGVDGGGPRSAPLRSLLGSAASMRASLRHISVSGSRAGSRGGAPGAQPQRHSAAGVAVAPPPPLARDGVAAAASASSSFGAGALVLFGRGFVSFVGVAASDDGTHTLREAPVCAGTASHLARCGMLTPHSDFRAAAWLSHRLCVVGSAAGELLVFEDGVLAGVTPLLPRAAPPADAAAVVDAADGGDTRLTGRSGARPRSGGAKVVAPMGVCALVACPNDGGNDTAAGPAGDVAPILAAGNSDGAVCFYSLGTACSDARSLPAAEPRRLILNLVASVRQPQASPAEAAVTAASGANAANGEVSWLAVSPSGGTLLAGHACGRVHSVQPAAAISRSVPAATLTALPLCSHPRVPAWNGGGGGDQTLVTPTSAPAITAMDVAMRRPLVATVGRGASLRLWNYADGACELACMLEEQPVGVALHPSGLYVAVVTASGLRAYAIQLDALVEMASVHVMGGGAARYSVGGALLAVAVGTGIHVYRAPGLELVASLRGHSGRVQVGGVLGNACVHPSMCRAA